MTNNINILAVCKDQKILNVLTRVINNQPEWTASGSSSINEATHIIKNEKVHFILLDAGLTTSEEQNIINTANTKNDEIIIIQHYGGGSGLLKNEILHAINLKNNKKLPSDSYINDANT